jgi:DNA-binding response OmpR family regulator
MVSIVPASLTLVVPVEDGCCGPLQDLLSGTNHRVRPARNADEALTVLGQEQFDLVLLDLGVPGFDGIEILETLKCDSRVWHIPVIVVGNHDGVDDVVRSLELGAEDYLLAPLHPVLLGLRINSFLAKKRLQKVETEYIKIFEEQSADLNELKRELTRLRTADVRS